MPKDAGKSERSGASVFATICVELAQLSEAWLREAASSASIQRMSKGENNHKSICSKHYEQGTVKHFSHWNSPINHPLGREYRVEIVNECLTS